MKNFAYIARDSAGQQVTGTLPADSIEAAAAKLRADGRYVISLKPASESSSSSSSARSASGIKISRAEVIQLSNQLSVMLETGVTLSDALDCCGLNCTNPKLKRLVDQLTTDVQAGIDFSTALSRHPRSFPRLYIALIKASEKSGKMSQMLTRATTYLRDEQETLRKVKGALTYPSIMLGFAVLTTVFLLIFVLPRFTTIYANKGAALPLPTKILMGMSNGLIHHWYIVVPSVLLAVVGGWIFFRSRTGVQCRDFLELNLPGIGAMFRKMHLSRGLRTIGTMAGSGVNLVECVETARELTSNGHYQRLWSRTLDQIQNGRPFSEPLSQSKLVPPAVTRMLASGEKGGKLGMVMEQVAGFSEHELKEKIAELTRYIEPAMILLMGLLIGGITLALLLPVFSISKVVAN